MIPNVTDIEGFSKSEYMMAFFAILFGYITSEYFRGFGILLRNRNYSKFPWAFVLFAVMTFVLLTIYWFNVWARSFQLENNFLIFVKILVYPMLFYLLSNLLFRNLSKTDLADLENYFFRRKRLLLATLGAYFFYDQFASYNKADKLYTAIGLAFCLACIFIKNRLHIKILLITGVGVVMAYTLQTLINPLSIQVAPVEQTSYSKVEHLTIFVSFIYGFVVAIYLKGWSYLVTDWKALKYSWGHLLWTVFSFFILISVWWNSWIRGGYMEDRLVYFQLSLVPPFLIYMISLVIFPVKKDLKNTDLATYFENNRRAFYQLFLIFFLLNIGLSLLFRESVYIGYTVPFRLLATLMALIALLVKNKYFHQALPFAAFSVYLFYLVINN